MRPWLEVATAMAVAGEGGGGGGGDGGDGGGGGGGGDRERDPAVGQRRRSSDTTWAAPGVLLRPLAPRGRRRPKAGRGAAGARKRTDRQPAAAAGERVDRPGSPPPARVTPRHSSHPPAPHGAPDSPFTVRRLPPATPTATSPPLPTDAASRDAALSARATCPPSEAAAPPAASAARAGGDVRGLRAGAADRGKRRVAATARAWRGTPSPLPLCCSRYPPGRSRGSGRSRYPRRPPSPFQTQPIPSRPQPLCPPATADGHGHTAPRPPPPPDGRRPSQATVASPPAAVADWSDAAPRRP